MAATAVTALVDPRSHLIVYASAGHPPPVLLRPDRTVETLDQASDPPLGARPEHVPRPQAGIQYRPGDTLVLCTDGLIERHGEDIDAGLTRLTDALADSGSVLSPQTRTPCWTGWGSATAPAKTSPSSSRASERARNHKMAARKVSPSPTRTTRTEMPKGPGRGGSATGPGGCRGPGPDRLDKAWLTDRPRCVTTGRFLPRVRGLGAAGPRGEDGCKRAGQYLLPAQQAQPLHRLARTAEFEPGAVRRLPACRRFHLRTVPRPPPAPQHNG